MTPPALSLRRTSQSKETVVQRLLTSVTLPGRNSGITFELGPRFLASGLPRQLGTLRRLDRGDRLGLRTFGRRGQRLLEQPAALLDVLHLPLRREAAPLQELLAKLGEERAVHSIPASFVAAEALQLHLDLVDVGVLTGMDAELEVLADAEVEGREPDKRLQPA